MSYRIILIMLICTLCPDTKLTSTPSSWIDNCHKKPVFIRTSSGNYISPETWGSEMPIETDDEGDTLYLTGNPLKMEIQDIVWKGLFPFMDRFYLNFHIDRNDNTVELFNNLNSFFKIHITGDTPEGFVKCRISSNAWQLRTGSYSYNSYTGPELFLKEDRKNEEITVTNTPNEDCDFIIIPTKKPWND